VKGIIFFTFWQKAVVGLVNHFGYIPHGFDQASGEYWCKEYVTEGIQNFLLCFEMLGFAIGHTYAYPASEFNEWEARHILENAVIKGSEKDLKNALEYAKKCGVKDWKIDIQSDPSHWTSTSDAQSYIVSAYDKNEAKVDMVFKAAGDKEAGSPGYPITLNIQDALVGEVQQLYNKQSSGGQAGVGAADGKTQIRAVGYLKELYTLVHDVFDLRDFAKRNRRAANLVKHPDFGNVDSNLIYEVFQTIDRHDNKKIDYVDLKHVHKAADIEIERDVFDKIDKNQDGTLDFKEFEDYFTQTQADDVQRKSTAVSNRTGLVAPLLA